MLAEFPGMTEPFPPFYFHLTRASMARAAALSACTACMRFQVEASLTYDFATPCEILLLVEAAHGQDQQVTSGCAYLLATHGGPAYRRRQGRRMRS